MIEATEGIAEKEKEKIDYVDLIKKGEKTDHKVDFIYPKNFPQPPNIDLVKRKLGQEQQDLLPLIDLIYNFLNMPIVEDYFGTDEVGRRQWELKVESAYGQEGKNVIEANLLRQNAMAEGISSVHMLADFLDNNDLMEIFSKIDKRIFDHKLYKELSNEGKIAILENVYKTIVAMLNELVKTN